MLRRFAARLTTKTIQRSTSHKHFLSTMATPIIVCGVTSKMSSRVAPRLAPEYEVIQFIDSVARAKSEIPALKTGKEVAPDADNVGTHNFSKSPEAVVFGRGFDEIQVEDIRQACGGDASGLTWMMAKKEDIEKVKASPVDFRDPAALDAYAEQVAAANKAALNELKAGGRWANGQLHYY